MAMNPNPYINQDLQALAETARRFAQERVAPGFLERDRSRTFDRALMREMGELGFIVPELPEQFGGLGLGCLAAGVIHEEIARADLSMSYINLLGSLNGQILSHHGRPDVVGPWLARLTRGEALLALRRRQHEPGLPRQSRRPASPFPPSARRDAPPAPRACSPPGENRPPSRCQAPDGRA